MKTIVVLLAVFALSNVHGLYLKSDQRRSLKTEQLIRSWNNFCNKLRFPNEEIASTTESQQPIFNEYEALNLIPALLELNKRDLLLQSEKKLLSEIYGDVWFMIEQETHRQTDAAMNPLLRAILNLVKFLQTDTNHNTLQRIPKSGLRKLIINKTPSSQHPLQSRLLNLAAVLLHAMESVNKRSGHGRRLKRSAPKVHLNLEWTNIPLAGDMPRSKRQMNRRTAQYEDLPAERIDSALEKFLQDKGWANDRDYSDLDDASLDDFFGSSPSSDDYTSYEYDDDRRKTYGGADFENGSFQDLIMLAAQHNLRNGNYY